MYFIWKGLNEIPVLKDNVIDMIGITSQMTALEHNLACLCTLNPSHGGMLLQKSSESRK